MSNVQDHVILLLQILKQKTRLWDYLCSGNGCNVFSVWMGRPKLLHPLLLYGHACNTAVVVRLKFSLANVDCHRPGMRAD